MKVLCIDGDLASMENCPHPDVNVVEGCIYTVVDSEKSHNSLMYKLYEMPDLADSEFWWDADAFVPISDVDETEMIREYISEKVLI